MQIHSQASLKSYNTFGLDAVAKTLAILESSDDVEKCFDEYPDGLVIGGGSNILLTQPLYDVVILNRIKGIEITEEKWNEVVIAVGSGENWHQLVLWTLKNNYGGLENLSLIPGTAGAAPIQNIGAYGAELKDVLHGIDYFRYNDHANIFVPAEDCKFAYRDSIFKNDWKNKGFISRIYLRLTRHDQNVNTSYQALHNYLTEQGWNNPTIHQVSQAVIDIRQSKLPDWRKIGNAGSFFKNPVVSRSFYEKLTTDYPNAPSFPVDESNVKIPAAWLIQEAGFKGKRIDQVGTYQYQPLVLVNYGGGTADDLLQLKDEIKAAVESKFGIALTPEVTIL